MAKQIEHKVLLTVYDNVNELSDRDKALVLEAEKVSQSAYAPYSQFYVGAAIRLKSGNVVVGSNQENMAYPSGLCAERVAIFYANSTYPNDEVEVIAITAHAENFEVTKPITPCGACRQAIAEYEIKQAKPIRIIMASGQGEVHECNGITELLPFMFNEQELKKE